MAACARIWMGAFVLVAAGVAAAHDVQLLTHDSEQETFVDEHGELHGVKGAGLRAFLVEVVDALIADLDHQPREIKVVPFARGFRMVQNTPGCALFNVGRTEEREDTVRWVGPTFESEVWFYKRRGADLEITSIEDAKAARRVCVQNGAGDEALLSKLGFENLQRVKSQGQGLKMVALGRADLAPVGEIVFESLCQEFGVSPDALERTSVRVAHTIGYIAFSKDTPDEVIERWQKALDALKASPRYKELIDGYLTSGG
jgi:polar amino acid transport system substrate-binding protein